MASSKRNSATPDALKAIDRAFADRRHEIERYRREATFLRREAEMKVNAAFAEQLRAVARHFDELAASVEKSEHGRRRP